MTSILKKLSKIVCKIRDKWPTFLFFKAVVESWAADCIRDLMRRQNVVGDMPPFSNALSQIPSQFLSFFDSHPIQNRV